MRKSVERRISTRSSDTPAKRPTPYAPFARAIGRTRFVVLGAVAAVLLVSITLFVLSTVQAVAAVWHALQAMLAGDFASRELTVEFLEIVSGMLKAVVFYIVGVGLYSLFIAPLNVTAALGVETFSDLETKVVSVIIVILAITFLEHFIAWQQPSDTLMFGLTLAAVVAALVLFQFHSERAKEAQKTDDPATTERAQEQLFHEDQEERDVRSEQTAGDGGPSSRT